MKIGVIGLGGTGSAALRYLARSDHQVVGYEQFDIGHVHGSSHGESRMIRYTYPDLFYTQLVADAYRLWDELEKDAHEQLFIRCGVLYFGHKDHPDIVATERSLIDAELPYDRFNAEEIRFKYPAFQLQPNEIALYQKDGGFLRATRCIQANIRLAKAHGAIVHERTPVIEIVSSSENGKILVRCSSDDTIDEEFDRVIVTAGPWMSRLFKDLNLPLTLTRQQIIYLNINDHEEYFQADDTFPVWIDPDANYYGFPSDGQIDGIKLASDDLGEIITDLDAHRRPVDDVYIDQIRQYAEKRFPNLGKHVTHSQTCIYTNTPNSDFIIDHVSDQPNVFLVSGCSGHGFKFTILLGKIIAMLAIGDEKYKQDLSRFQIATIKSFIQSPSANLLHKRY